jgi:8-oxo-dGTP pyrophosphatase MutT (NUDIX family)
MLFRRKVPILTRSSQEHSVRVFLEGDGQAFLVQERGNPSDPRFDDPGGKNPGWNLPGGKVEGTLDQIINGIRREVVFRRIETERHRINAMFVQCLHLADTRLLQRILLTAVKEVLEEAGVLISPISVQEWARTETDTVWLVRAHAMVFGDTTRGGDAKIVSAAWYPVNQLPRPIFRRARKMVHALTRRRTAS